MTSIERTRELLKGLSDGVVAFDEEAVAKLSRDVLEEGIDAQNAIMNGLAIGMEKVAELYVKKEYFVPELLLCADALYAGLDILKPYTKVEEQDVKLRIVIGTVEGDIHDIGKNLVKIMFEAAGWIVYDLGYDVKLERFVEEQLNTKSDIVAISAMMSTSMLAIPKVIEMVKTKDSNAAIMVGGAPMTRNTAELYGADGYADNAGLAVREALSVIARLRSATQK